MKALRPFTIKTIADPVHGTLYLTPAEQLIVDAAEFQRLRFVLQQSTAYLSYPSNSTNRFSHSLGVAHNAGRMLHASLHNASTSDALAFLQDAHALILSLRKELASPPLAGGQDPYEFAIPSLIGDPSIFHSTPPIDPLPIQALPLLNTRDVNKASGLTNQGTYAILWQATRFAALVHDLGHLPMSHLFELAIKDHDATQNDLNLHLQPQVMKAYADAFRREMSAVAGALTHTIDIHEALGCMLVEKVLPGRDDLNSHQMSLVNLLKRLACNIVTAIPVHHTISDSGDQSLAGHAHIIRFLHSILAGDIDADRLDYASRDPKASGLNGTAAHPEKIIRAQKLVDTKTIRSDQLKGDARYRLAIDHRSVLEVEQWYLSRYFGFRHIVYNHNISRSECILRRILSIIMTLRLPNASTPIQSSLRKTLEQYMAWKAESNGSLHFGPLIAEPNYIGQFDDAWLRSLLYTLWHDLSTSRDPLSPELYELKVLTDVFLRRKIDMCISFIKNDYDTLDFYEELRAELCDYILVNKLEHGTAAAEITAKRIAGAAIYTKMLVDHAPRISSLVSQNLASLRGVAADPVFTLVHYENAKLPSLEELDRILIAKRDGVRTLRAASRILAAVAGTMTREAITNATQGDLVDPDGIPCFNLPQFRLFLVGQWIETCKRSQNCEMDLKQIRRAVVRAVSVASVEAWSLK